jgi:hypothetical protein
MLGELGRPTPSPPPVIAGARRTIKEAPREGTVTRATARDAVRATVAARKEAPEVRPHSTVAAVAAGAGASENHYALVYGSKGKGKTTYARKVYSARIARGGSGVFIDRTGRNGDLAELPGGGRVCRTLGAFYAYSRARILEGRPINAIVALGWGEDHNRLWPMLYEIGNLLLVLDEAEQFASAHRIDPDLSELVSLGRNRRVDILSTVRTPPELHTRLRGNRDVVICFGQSYRRFAEQLNSEFFGLEDGGRIIHELPALEYLRTAEGRTTRGRLRVPWA